LEILLEITVVYFVDFLWPSGRARTKMPIGPTLSIAGAATGYQYWLFC